jgi:hypothetical protein
MTGPRPTAWRLGARQHLHLRTESPTGSGPSSTRLRCNANDRLLAPLRRHRGWTLLGLIVAALATATRFAAIGTLPPSIMIKPFAHANASTELALGKTSSFGYSKSSREPYGALSTRTYALAAMVDSPEITDYVARAAGLPASKIGILGPRWVELQREQQFPSGPQRDRQIIIEKDPYQITLDQETTQPGEGPGPGSGPPVIDVETQAPSTALAVGLARAVPAALHAYVEHAQATAGVPERDRYDVSQLVPVSVSPARKSQLADVGVFTFFAVLVLWCGAEIAVSSLMRDLRTTAAA